MNFVVSCFNQETVTSYLQNICIVLALMKENQNHEPHKI